MITYTVEMKLEDFNAWGGAEARLQTIKDLDRVEEATDFINECIEGLPMEDITETTINDILWFSMDELIEEWEEEEEA